MSFAVAAHPRWDGTRGRMEVWYASITEPRSGTGLWIHYELVAPDDEADAPYRHGWAAVFGPGAPVCERFGPEPVGPGQDHRAPDDVWFPSSAGTIGPGSMTGRAGEVSWDLSWQSSEPPLWTFPQLAWTRELLPGAQCVPVPTGAFIGSVDVGGDTLELDGATGNVAHIYGHGSAKRWGWLHADLGGGDVLEIVTAVSMTAGLNRLPPTAYLRLRADGHDWPRGPLPAFRTTSRLDGHEWSVSGKIGGRRVRVEVTQPPERSVALQYVDPDGETATCTNSEVADATIVVEERSGGRWRDRHRWQLDRTAHAEFGTRP